MSDTYAKKINGNLIAASEAVPSSPLSTALNDKLDWLNGYYDRNANNGSGWAKIASITKNWASNNLTGIWDVAYLSTGDTRYSTLELNIRFDATVGMSLNRFVHRCTGNYNTNLSFAIYINGTNNTTTTVELWAKLSNGWHGVAIREVGGAYYHMNDRKQWTYYKTTGGGTDKPTADPEHNIQVVDVTVSQISLSTHTHGNITSAGALQTTDVAIASGDKLVITDSSNSSKIARTSVSFDGSTTTTALTPKGTFESFAKAADITTAIQALDVSSVGGAGKYISAISETDGKISATATTMDTTPTANSTNAVTSGGIKNALDTKVAGPSSATDDDIAVFDGTTGKLVKDGGKKISNLAGKTGVVAYADAYVRNVTANWYKLASSTYNSVNSCGNSSWIVTIGSYSTSLGVVSFYLDLSVSSGASGAKISVNRLTTSPIGRDYKNTQLNEAKFRAVVVGTSGNATIELWWNPVQTNSMTLCIKELYGNTTRPNTSKSKWSYYNYDDGTSGQSAEPTGNASRDHTWYYAKQIQNAVTDPTASGTALSFIDSIAQNDNGKITPTKKTVALDSTPTASSENPVSSGGVKTALDKKVNIANISLEAQTTTLLAQVQAMGAAGTHYARFYTRTDGGSANISDKPESGSKGFVCEVVCKRYGSSSDYRYNLTCWVQSSSSPYVATVATASTGITWTKLSETYHASPDTTYGVGTTANYGHVKLDNSTPLTVGTSSSDGVATGKAHIHNALESVGRASVTTADLAHINTNSCAHMILSQISGVTSTTHDPGDGYMLTFMWDGAPSTGMWDYQLFIPNSWSYESNGYGRLKARARDGGANAWADWHYLAAASTGTRLTSSNNLNDLKGEAHGNIIGYYWESSSVPSNTAFSDAHGASLLVFGTSGTDYCIQVELRAKYGMYQRCLRRGTWGAWEKILVSSDITTGTTNGTISVDGSDVAVKGLGGAAYLNTGTASGTVATGNHTHTVKINGSEKTIAATGGTAVNLGTFKNFRYAKVYAVTSYNASSSRYFLLAEKEATYTGNWQDTSEFKLTAYPDSIPKYMVFRLSFSGTKTTCSTPKVYELYSGNLSSDARKVIEVRYTTSVVANTSITVHTYIYIDRNYLQSQWTSFQLEPLSMGTGDRSNNIDNGLTCWSYKTAETYVTSLTGTTVAHSSESILVNISGTASKATSDANGNNIASTYATKLGTGHSGKIAALDTNGNLADSGLSTSNVSTAINSISGKIDKVSDATTGNIPSITNTGDLEDSGISVTSVANKNDAVYYVIGTTDYPAWVANHAYAVNDNAISGGKAYYCKTAHTSGSEFDSSKWTAIATPVLKGTLSGVTELYEGLKIALKWPITGGSSSTYLNINNLGNVYIRRNDENITTHLPANSVSFLAYDGTYWRWADYDSDTKWVTTMGAYCDTAPGTQAKVATSTSTVYTAGESFLIRFTQANSYNGKITLNINGQGARDIWINGAVSSSSNKTLPAGEHWCHYDGSVFHIWTDGTAQFTKLNANKLTTKADQYTDDGATCGIDMQNSNIVGLNAIYTKDKSVDASEGIHFYRDATHTDTLWMAGGHMYFVPNRALAGSSASTTAANSNKVAILPATLTNGYFLVTDGTDGNVAISNPATTQVGYSTSSGNATTCNGWKIVVGSLGQSTDTIYFVTT